MAIVAGFGACETAEPGSSEAEDPVELVGTTWQWEAFEDSADGEESNDIGVVDPARYTLTLLADGVVRMQADCNQLSWTYALQGSSLAFDPQGPGTLAYCGEESRDQRYLGLLSMTATYVMADGKLYLNLQMDAGNMVFATR